MGPCCPFASGAAGSPPYLLWAFIVFLVVSLVMAIKKLDRIVQLLEKK